LNIYSTQKVLSPPPGYLHALGVRPTRVCIRLLPTHNSSYLYQILEQTTSLSRLYTNLRCSDIDNLGEGLKQLHFYPQQKMGYGLNRNPLKLIIGMGRFELSTPKSRTIFLM